ncbi:MAG TPA: hypothetical protein ENJ80_10230 [Gammaproteobacteria bacterium]|nr:hypothetical protein [Gammaproteobacteria bacterium]
MKDMPHQITLAKQWLARQRPRKYINQRISSYGLKHLAERWHRAQGTMPGTDCYVSNDALIAAARQLNYDVKPIPGSPNACLNIEIRERP